MILVNPVFYGRPFGHDSDGGTEVTIPYYFNLSPNLDATYTPRSIWKRGITHEGELRHLNNYGENLLAGDIPAFR